jgi:hypothetical protein
MGTTARAVWRAPLLVRPYNVVTSKGVVYGPSVLLQALDCFLTTNKRIICAYDPTFLPNVV